MKSFKLKSVFALLMLVFLAASCGKDDKKKNRHHQWFNGYGYPSFGQINGSQAFQQLQNWANGVEQYNGMSTLMVQRKVTDSGNGCKTFLSIFEFCSYSNIGGTTETEYVQVLNGQAKLNYQHIKEIVTPEPPMQLIQVTAPSYGILEVYHADTNTNKLVQYMINTNYPAAANPVVIQDNVLGVRKEVISF